MPWIPCRWNVIFLVWRTRKVSSNWTIGARRQGPQSCSGPGGVECRWGDEPRPLHRAATAGSGEGDTVSEGHNWTVTQITWERKTSAGYGWIKRMLVQHSSTQPWLFQTQSCWRADLCSALQAAVVSEEFERLGGLHSVAGEAGVDPVIYCRIFSSFWCCALPRNHLACFAVFDRTIIFHIISGVARYFSGSYSCITSIHLDHFGMIYQCFGYELWNGGGYIPVLRCLSTSFIWVLEPMLQNSPAQRSKMTVDLGEAPNWSEKFN